MKFRHVLFVLFVIYFGVIVGLIMALAKELFLRMAKSLALVILLTGSVAAEDRLLTPAQAVAAAAKDLATIQGDARLDTRYVSLYNIPADSRDMMIRVMSGHFNGLSTESDIVKPGIVPGTDNTLLRILISDYGWTVGVWEKLTQAEPYFHAFVQEEVEVEVVNEYGHQEGNRFIVTERRKEKETKVVRKFSAQAPWTAATKEQQVAIKSLVESTNSECPIVRADWFLWQTSLQADRMPGYYDFLGVKTKKDFEDLIGFDAKLAKKAKRTEYLEAVAESGIAQQPRRIRRDNTIGGMGFWQTFDNKAAVDKNNPLRVLDNENFKFDASEMFGPLPNNFWAYALFSANGDRQDSAPDFIGHDSTSRSNDGRIHVGLSCVRCHGPNSGLNPIDAWARNLLQPPLALQSPLPDKIRELRQQYLRDILGPMDDDRLKFARAVDEATGFAAKEYAAKYGELFARYDQGVDLERAAADLGVLPEVFRAALDRQSKSTGSVDTVLSTFLRPKQQQKTVAIRQWQEAYPVAQLCLKSYE